MISKSIRVSGPVYQKLLELKRPMETCSEVITRLLIINTLIEKVLPLIREQREYFEKQKINGGN